MNKKRSDADGSDATLYATLSPGKRCTKELVSARLKEFRKKAHLTQQELADRANRMPLPSFKDYEGGNRLPGAEALEAFVAAGINANWLLTGDGQMQLAAAPGLAEKAPSPYGLVKEGIDSVLLQQVIEFFIGWLAENKDKVRISSDRWGTAIAVLYCHAHSVGEARKPELEQILSLAA